MSTIAIRFALVILFAAAAFAAGEDEIKAAEQRWATAVKTKDFAALEKIYAPGLIYAHATGAVQNKQEYMERLRTGKQRYDVVNNEKMQVVMYGDTAVTHSVLRMTGQNDAGPFNDHVMALHVWVKQGGMWHLAAHQTTKIP